MDMQYIIVAVFIIGAVLGSLAGCLGMALVQINFKPEHSESHKWN